MRFALLFELALPRPWAPDGEHRLVRDALAQAELADRLGFHRAWALERHFLEEHSHTSAPEVFLAAASQRTRQIRLGLGAIGEPARVAETTATLDLVSDGRAELAATADIDVVARMFIETPFAGGGSVPPRNVVPKPLQQPHPPLWLVCPRRAAISVAAEQGVGALLLAPVAPEEAEAWVEEYHAIVERCVPAGFAVNAQVAAVLPMHVHAEEAHARGGEGADFFAYARAHYEVFGDHEPGRTSIWDEFQARRELLAAQTTAIGTPAEVSELIARYESAGIDELVFAVQTGKTSHEHVCETLELFAAEVMPAFPDAKQPAAHADALARREPPRKAPAGYAFGPVEDAAPAQAPVVTPSRAMSLRRGGEAAFRAFVRRSDDRRLERTIGSAQGLRVLFRGMAAQFDPDRAGGFVGDIGYELRVGDGSVRTWTVSVGADSARAFTGRGTPRLTIKMTLADFIRIAAQDLDSGKALLEGRMDLEGDFSLAARLGEMFGQQP